MAVTAFPHHVLWFKCKVRPVAVSKVGSISFFPYEDCKQRPYNSGIEVHVLLKTALRQWDRELEASSH